MCVLRVCSKWCSECVSQESEGRIKASQRPSSNRDPIRRSGSSSWPLSGTGTRVRVCLCICSITLNIQHCELHCPLMADRVSSVHAGLFLCMCFRWQSQQIHQPHHHRSVWCDRRSGECVWKHAAGRHQDQDAGTQIIYQLNTKRSCYEQWSCLESEHLKHTCCFVFDSMHS